MVTGGGQAAPGRSLLHPCPSQEGFFLLPWNGRGDEADLPLVLCFHLCISQPPEPGVGLGLAWVFPLISAPGCEVGF